MTQDANKKRLNPLDPGVQERPIAERFGALMGLLEAFSIQNTRAGTQLHDAGVEAVMGTKFPNAMNIDPHEFALKCWYAASAEADMRTYCAQERQDQIIALLASTTDMPKAPPDPTYLHYYYLARHALMYPAKVPLAQWAADHGITPDSARQKAGRGGFHTAEKVGRDWTIDPNEPNTDGRVKDGAYKGRRRKRPEASADGDTD